MSSESPTNPCSKFLYMVQTMSPSQERALRICIAYATASITISMMYKAILSTWEFDGKFLLLAAQAGFSLAVCWVLLQVAPATAESLKLREFQSEAFWKSIPLGVLYVLNISVGWFGLQLVDVPMFLAIRRTAAAFVLAGEVLILRLVPSPMAATGIAIIVLGTLIAGYETFSTEYIGYLYTVGNNIITAVQLSFAKRFQNETGVQGFGLVFYNGLTALPLALVGAVLRDEVSMTMQYEHVFNPWFHLSVLLASALGCFMTYIVLLCATVNSPTITSVTGNLKDVVATLVGAVLFPGFQPTLLKVSGLLVSFTGGGLFAYAKLLKASTSSAKTPASDGSHSVGAATSPSGASQANDKQWFNGSATASQLADPRKPTGGA